MVATADLAQDSAEIAQPSAIQSELAPFRFNQANARQFAAKSHEARRLRYKIASQPSQQLTNGANSVELTHARTIAKLEQHLERLDEALSKAKEASDWRDLTTARMRLHDQWCDLTGTHKPGPSKPPRESTRRAQVVVLPMEEQPAQQMQAIQPEPVKTEYWNDY